MGQLAPSTGISFCLAHSSKLGMTKTFQQEHHLANPDLGVGNPDLNEHLDEESVDWDFPQTPLQPTFEFRTRSIQPAELPVSFPVYPTSEPYLLDDGESSAASTSHLPDNAELPDVSEAGSPVGVEKLGPGDNIPGPEFGRPEGQL